MCCKVHLLECAAKICMSRCKLMLLSWTSLADCKNEQHIACNTPCLLYSLVVATLCYGGERNRWCSARQLNIYFPLLNLIEQQQKSTLKHDCNIPFYQTNGQPISLNQYSVWN